MLVCHTALATALHMLPLRIPSQSTARRHQTYPRRRGGGGPRPQARWIIQSRGVIMDLWWREGHRIQLTDAPLTSGKGREAIFSSSPLFQWDGRTDGTQGFLQSDRDPGSTWEWEEEDRSMALQVVDSTNEVVPNCASIKVPVNSLQRLYLYMYLWAFPGS